MRLGLVLPALLILTACGPQAGVPLLEPSSSVSGGGALLLREGNSGIALTTAGFTELTATQMFPVPDPAKGKFFESSPMLGMMMQMDPMQSMQECGDGRYLAWLGIWVVLLDPQSPQDYLAFGMDAGGSGHHSGAPDEFCMLGNEVLILANRQQLLAYSTDGQLVGERYCDAACRLFASPDHSRAALASPYGLSILESSDSVVWQRRGFTNACSLGDRIVGIEASVGDIVCLDWFGSEIWRREFPVGQMLQLYSDSRSPLFVVSDGAGLQAIDRQGETVWTRGDSDELRQWPLVAPDGFVMIASDDVVHGSSKFCARFTCGNKFMQQLICLDPGGRPVWSMPARDNGYNSFICGYGGRLYCGDPYARCTDIYDPTDLPQQAISAAGGAH